MVEIDSSPANDTAPIARPPDAAEAAAVLSRAISDCETVQEVVRNGLSAFQHLFGVEAATLYLADESGRSLRIADLVPPDDERLKLYEPALPVDSEGHAAAFAFRASDPLLYGEGYETLPPRSADLYERLGHSAVLAAPVTGHGGPVGALLLATAGEPRRLSEHTALVHLLARYLALAIQQARQREELTNLKARAESQHAQAVQLRDLAADLTVASTEQEVCLSIARRIAALFRAGGCAIAKVEPDEQTLRVCGVLSDSPGSERTVEFSLPVRQTDGFYKALHKGGVERWTTAVDATQKAYAEQVPIHETLCTRLIGGGRPRGLLLIHDRRDGGAWTEDDAQFLEVVAAQVAALLESARLYAEEHRRAQQLGAFLRETHDRVKNNLQMMAAMLEMYAGRESVSPAAALQASYRRIQTISLVYGMLTEGTPGEKIDSRHLVEVVAYHSFRRLPDGNMHALAIEADSFPLGVRSATALAVVLNELVTNAVAHGLDGEKKGQIRVAVTQNEGQIVCSVEDSGRGVESERPTFGVGLEMARVLTARDLHGALRFSPSPLGGLRVEVDFPTPICK